MPAPTLTIGQLAARAGVTVRAVRHYHQRGLLAEPERDASGYRRYGAQAVVDLIKIKTLAGAGVPLARIQQLPGADPREFRQAIAEIDRSLASKIRNLSRQRRRIAELASGERLVLPEEVVAILDGLRAMGVSEQTVRTERDAWILMAALSPDMIPEWAAEKSAAMAGPEFRSLYLACDRALGWDPSDPRLGQIAAELVAWHAKRRAGTGQSASRHAAPDPPAITLMEAHIMSVAPAWQKLAELALALQQAQRRGPDRLAAGDPGGPAPG